MAFTYSNTLATDRDKVRFYIGDTIANAGPRPGAATGFATNFDDNELDGLITVEGSWQRAVAGAFEVLSAAYAGYADISIGQRRESLSQIAVGYATKAAAQREKFGAASASRAGTVHLTRADGYSDDYPADES